MKKFLVFGNYIAVLSIAGAGLLSLYSIYLVTRDNHFCAWAAIIVCVLWFVSLLIRTHVRKNANV